MDQDGFHSIAWDDAPSSNPPLSGPSPSQSPFEEGFESISPSSAQLPISEQYEGYDNSKAGGSGEVAVSLDRRERLGGHEVDGSIWNGKWMDVQVREPAKEHEGSKDMYVSYAVKTEASLWLREWGNVLIEMNRRAFRHSENLSQLSEGDFRTSSFYENISSRTFQLALCLRSLISIV